MQLMPGESVVASFGNITLTTWRVQYEKSEWGAKKVTTITLDHLTSCNVEAHSKPLWIVLALLTGVLAFQWRVLWIVAVVLFIVWFLTRRKAIVLRSASDKIEYFGSFGEWADLQQFLHKIQTTKADRESIAAGRHEEILAAVRKTALTGDQQFATSEIPRAHQETASPEQSPESIVARTRPALWTVSSSSTLDSSALIASGAPVTAPAKPASTETSSEQNAISDSSANPVSRSAPERAYLKEKNQFPILIGVPATAVLVLLVAATLWLRSSRNNVPTSAGQAAGEAGLKTKGKPSFDCARARTATESEICADGDLATLEVSMVAAYKGALDRLPATERSDFRRQHLEWFKRYQESCNALAQAGAGERLKKCISKALSNHTEDLQAFMNPDALAASDTLPTAIGQCTKTTISKIGTRLTEGVNGPNILGSGSLISYADGGGQVSYDTVPGIEHSRVGDKVLLCLVSVPTSCPPGDDRGKLYSTKNLRTGETWRLPNSQHSCGGA
jgi:uncharacterized protein